MKRTLPSMPLLGFLAILGSTVTFTPAMAQQAQQEGLYDSRVSNPFVFCSLPKPCKRCQPWKGIYEQICEPNIRESERLRHLTEEARSKIPPEYLNYIQTKSFLNEYSKINASIDALKTGDSEEINQFINWLAKQPGPKGFNGTMEQYWKKQGIYDIYNEPKIRQYAIENIEKANKTIMESILNNKYPPKKPWIN